MSEVNNKAESKVEVKRIRSRNSYDTINQIMESYNSSQGWALKKVSMIGMNIDVVVERSVDQNNDTKEVSNAKQSKEETSKTSEPQKESKEIIVDVEDAQSTPNTSDKPSVKRGRAAKK